MNTSNKYSKILTIALIVIILIIVGVLIFLAASSLRNKSVAERYTEEANEFEKVVTSRSSRTGNTNTTLNAIDPSQGDNKRYMDGYEIIGTIEIPKIDFKCVILDEVTKHSIEIGIGKMFTENGLNKPGNTVLYGHNRRDSNFFGRNDELVIGDKVYILDQEGTKLTYEIYHIEVISGTDTTYYINGETVPTVLLSTCTDDVNTTDNRLVILARAIDYNG